MATLGATLTSVSPGMVEIQLPFRPDLTQQHRFLHAGILTTVLDSRTITVCKADGLMMTSGNETVVATMLATIMTVRDRPEVVG